MTKAKQFQKNIRSRQVLLYRNVFYSRVSASVVFCLLTSFVLQPFERSFAAELEPEIVSTTEAIVNLAVDAKLVTEADAEVATPINDITPETSASQTDGTNDLPKASTSTSNQLASNVSVVENATIGSSTTPKETNILGPLESNSNTSESNSSSTSTTTVLTDEEIQALITPADAIPESSLEVESATITATTTENPIAVSNVYSDATMQFNKNDCVTVEDGSFYCQVKKEEIVEIADGLFALQDIDGDLEIYLRKNGELTQLTFNTVDDGAPYFDSSSDSIVWHRLIDDRYQIISYSIELQTETQLTAEAVNNMEPSRSGVHTVWQRWNNNNWDIVLYDGVETTFITDSGMHDIAPKVKGDLVMWNRLHPDTTQTIELYDIVTKEFTTISDTEGGALSNPRMVLVYETEFENGDIITKGYDVETGEITPITSKAAEIPDELPEPDATGETRALLPVKNPSKEDGEIFDDIFPELAPPATNTPTVILPGDLVIASTTVSVSPNVNIASTTDRGTDFTLDLTRPILSVEEATMTIAIPVYVAPTSTVSLTDSEILEPITTATNTPQNTTEESTP